MSFYDEIAKGINYEICPHTEGYLKVINGVLQLPSPRWLQYHLPFLDKVIEAIDAFRCGLLTGLSYDISQIKKHVYTTPEEAISFLGQVQEQYRDFAIDIESRNLSTDRAKNKLLCIGIAYKDDEGASFTRECFESALFRTTFEQFLHNKANRFILHNGVFDRSRAKIIEGLEIRIDDDTLLKHYCGINEHKGTHGLKDLAQLYLGFPDWEKPLDEWKKQYCRTHKIKLSEFQYDAFPLTMLAEYNVIDCCATFQLDHVFDQLMRCTAKPIYRKLIEAAPCYADMIARGMQMDLEYWAELRDQLNKERAELDKYFSEAMPGVLITSPVQLKRWLQKEFPFDGVDTTGAKIIEELSEKHPEREELQAILKYRKNTKYLKTYVTGLYERMDCDGIIHCEFKLHGTETGRLSSANPKHVGA